MSYLIVLIVANTGTYSYNTYDFRSFAGKQKEVTADTSRASCAIKVMDATGNVLKAEELTLTP